MLLTIFITLSLIQENSPLLYEFGEFKSAASFSYSDAGYFYVIDEESNEIFKFDTLGNEIISIGGFGSGKESFNSPVNVFATTLNIYISDKYNDRIVFMDKDLNYLSELKSPENEEEEFGYPSAAGVSYQGDLFILDSDNGRVLKYDLNGNYLMQIGNFDSGEFYLNSPKDLTITSNGEIVILDTEKIFFFDQFGNGLRSFKPPINIEGINFSNNKLLLLSKNTVYYIPFSKGSLKLHKWEIQDKNLSLVDAVILNNKIYVLTKNRILVYNFE